MMLFDRTAWKIGIFRIAEERWAIAIALLAVAALAGFVATNGTQWGEIIGLSATMLLVPAKVWWLIARRRTRMSS